MVACFSLEMILSCQNHVQLNSKIENKKPNLSLSRRRWGFALALSFGSFLGPLGPLVLALYVCKSAISQIRYTETLNYAFHTQQQHISTVTTNNIALQPIPLQNNSTAAQQYCSTIALQHHSTPAQQYFSTIALQHSSTATKQHCNTTALQHNSTALWYYCSTIVLKHNNTKTQQHCRKGRKGTANMGSGPNRFSILFLNVANGL